MDQQRLQAPALRAHLQLDAPCRPELRVQTLPYESVLPELRALNASLGPRDRVWISDKASGALTQAIPKVSTEVGPRSPPLGPRTAPCRAWQSLTRRAKRFSSPTVQIKPPPSFSWRLNLKRSWLQTQG